MALAVIKAASGWLAVHKPAGLSVHNDPREDLCAGVRGQIESDPRLAQAVQMDPDWGVHAVHRLDRDTSGVLLLATRVSAFRALSRLFQGRAVAKHYLAVVHGRVEPPVTGKNTEAWGWPLSPKGGGRSRPAGGGKRLPSLTRFTVLAHAERYTLISCEPVSGRQHQIRRHAKMARHPVVGDRRYGSKKALAYLQDHFSGVRLALHAWRLSFVPPGHPPQDRLTLRAEPMPDFMQQLMGALDLGMLIRREAPLVRGKADRGNTARRHSNDYRHR